MVGHSPVRGGTQAQVGARGSEVNGAERRLSADLMPPEDRGAEERIARRTAARRVATGYMNQLRAMATEHSGRQDPLQWADADILAVKLNEAQEAFESLRVAEVFDPAAETSSQRRELREAIALGRRRLTRLEGRLQQQDVVPAVQQAADVHQRPDTGASSLPTIKLGVFDGAVEAYADWRAAFDALVDATSLSAAVKLVHLRSALNGEPSEAIRYLPLTEQGYRAALATLEQRFSRPQLAIQLHWRGLLELAPVTSDTAKCVRGLVTAMEGHLQCLTLQGALGPGEGQHLPDLILSKLPVTLIMGFQRKENAVNDQTGRLARLRAFLQDELRVMEDAEFLSGCRRRVQACGNSAFSVQARGRAAEPSVSGVCYQPGREREPQRVARVLNARVEVLEEEVPVILSARVEVCARVDGDSGLRKGGGAMEDVESGLRNGGGAEVQVESGLRNGGGAQVHGDSGLRNGGGAEVQVESGLWNGGGAEVQVESGLRNGGDAGTPVELDDGIEVKVGDRIEVKAAEENGVKVMGEARDGGGSGVGVRHGFSAGGTGPSSRAGGTARRTRAGGTARRARAGGTGPGSRVGAVAGHSFRTFPRGAQPRTCGFSDVA
jgi:hypothetical protein